MKINVLLFGVLAEKVGEDRMAVESVGDIDSLKNYIFEKSPEIKNMSFQVSVNQTITQGNLKLNEGDEVALLPPFAGG